MNTDDRKAIEHAVLVLNQHKNKKTQSTRDRLARMLKNSALLALVNVDGIDEVSQARCNHCVEAKPSAEVVKLARTGANDPALLTWRELQLVCSEILRQEKP